MSLKITNSSLFTKHYLIVDSGGVKFFESAGWGSARRFRFDQIECILMSPDHKLSFQVGNEVFSIQTKPDNAKHVEATDALLQEVRRTTATDKL